MRLEGKVALISGGGTGIGAATASLFAREGAKVVITGRRPEPIREVAAAIGGVAVAGDAADPAHAAEAVAVTGDAFAPPDILVVNHGTSAGGTPGDMTDAAWRSTLEANLTGAMNLCRAAIPVMATRGGGAIVLVSSVSGLTAFPGSADYSVSKAGLIGLARSIVVDHAADDIRANVVCPGWVKTPMADESMDELGAERGVGREEAYRLATRLVPAGRAAEPEEIARCILFLASEESSYVNGAILVADGGAGSIDAGAVEFLR